MTWKTGNKIFKLRKWKIRREQFLKVLRIFLIICLKVTLNHKWVLYAYLQSALSPVIASADNNWYKSFSFHIVDQRKSLGSSLLEKPLFVRWKLIYIHLLIWENPYIFHKITSQFSLKTEDIFMIQVFKKIISKQLRV